MKDKIEIYKGNKVIAEGRTRYKESIIAYARALYPDAQLVAQGYRENGTCYGFFVPKRPPIVKEMRRGQQCR
jgi:hypothetical protein